MATIYLHKNKKGVPVGYRADFGKDGSGKRVRILCDTKEAAEKLIVERTKEPVSTGLLYENRDEFLWCYTALKEVGATVMTATHFFLKHGAKKPNTTLKEILDLFVEDKARRNRRAVYIEQVQLAFGKFMEKVGASTLAKDIVPQQIEDYVLKDREDLQDITKYGILSNLSIVFNYAVRKDILSFNPVDKVERPTLSLDRPGIITPENLRLLLERCYDRNEYDRLALFLLVAYCGARIEEASKMAWRDINIADKLVEVPFEIAKKRRFRVIPIPENAYKWFLRIHDARKKEGIIGPNWKTLIRSTVRNSKLGKKGYPKNCLRHSFATYHYALGTDEKDITRWMGHRNKSDELHEHYKDNVPKKRALEYFSICPPIDQK